MTGYDICTVCDTPGTFAEATDLGSIPSNVRRFKQETFTVWRCHNCGSLHSRETVDLDKYYKDYPPNSIRLAYVTRCFFRERLRLLQAHGFSQQTSLLEVGCGSGIFLTYLREKGYKNVTGYDPFIPEFSDPSVLEQRYDRVVSYEVLEHVDSPGEYLKSYAHLLTDQGILVAQTPKADQIVLSDPYHVSLLHQPYHRHILSTQALLHLADRADLEVVKVYEDRQGSSFDTPFPLANHRLIVSYMYRFGNELDLLFETPRWQTLISPQILFFALAGFWFPLPSHMTAMLRRK